jgi:CRP-like cAMP-binding protein
MLELEKIKRYLSLFTNLSIADIYYLFTLAKEKKLKEGEVYIESGAISKKIAYVKSGIVRGYLVKENGEEATLILRSEDQFVASYDSILRNEKSRVCYHALENTILLEVDFEALMDLINKNPKYFAGRKYFFSNMANDLLERLESFVLLNPEERYQHFLKMHPGLAQRIQDKYIASYLGITPVSLSRIRKRIVQKKK